MVLYVVTYPFHTLLTLIKAPYTLAAAAWYHACGWAKGAPQQPKLTAKTAAACDAKFRHLSFTYAAIGLSAKLACADGKLSREKYVAFRELFPLQSDMCDKIRHLFALACKDDISFEHYATQVAHSLPGRTDLFASLVSRLFAIASADGEISRESERMLSRTAYMLGIPAHEYSELRARYVHASEPHHLLGIEKQTPHSTIKKRYRELMHRYHPDRFAMEKLSAEMTLLLQIKTAEISTAYRKLSRA